MLCWKTKYFKLGVNDFKADGHPSLQNRHGGIAKLINDTMTNNLYSQHCMAHTLLLKASHSFEKVGGIKNKLDVFVNVVFPFYYDKSFKRKE